MSIDLKNVLNEFQSIGGFGWQAGNGAPTYAANKGSLYTRLDGSSGSTRMYINTDGATTWTSFTTAG